MVRARVWVGLSASVLLAIGCDAAPPDAPAKSIAEPSPQPVPVAQPAPVAKTVTDATPVPVAQPAPVAKPAADAKPAEPVEATKSYSHAKVPADAPTFVVAGARGDGNNAAEVRLFELDGPQAFAASGAAVMRLRADGSIEHAADWARGIDERDVILESVESGYSWWQTELLGGGWPDGAVLVLRPQSGGRGGDETPAVYRRSNAVWSSIPGREALFVRFPRAVGRWKDGSLLALWAFEPRYAHPGDEESEPPAAEIAASAAAIAKQKRLVVLRGTPKAPAFGTRDVQAFASLATGEIIAAITTADHTLVLHHDATGDRELPLPGRGVVPGADLEVKMSAPDRAWLVGRGHAPPGVESTGYVARFDGAAWTEVPTECDSDPSSLSIDREGSAYFVCSVKTGEDDARAVLFRVRAGVLEELPVSSPPTGVVAIAPDDIWVSTGGWGDPVQLLHTGAPKGEPFAIPDSAASARAVLEWAAPRPFTAACQQAWLPLADGAKKADLEAKLRTVTPEDVYPQVLDVLAQGRVASGVLVPVSDKREARRIGKLSAALGDLVGEPICNAYPPAPGPG
ncbi:MAG: hypothetical protein JNK45_24870 [Myxococcales bacterium]|nr:hypothetical protein [Myxococcales bacterium]